MIRVDCFGLLLLFLIGLPVDIHAAEDRLNVLFIAVDDLRPELGCYGKSHIKSPHIDRLASQGTVFERAYCQVALCMPSRASLLTGRRPDTTKVYQFDTDFRDAIPDVVTLPQYFKQHGYHSQAFGKIFHQDDKASWSVPRWRSKRPEYQSKKGLQVLEWIKQDWRRVTFTWHLGNDITKSKRMGGLPWEAPDVPDNSLREADMTDVVIDTLGQVKDSPFFLAVGYHKPHLPFIAPKRYFDLYDTDQIKLADNPFPPRDVPRVAMYNWNDMRHYYGIPKVGPVSDAQARELRRAYYACVTYVDAQIGRLLDELDRLELRDHTIVIVWGDHGWQLGEHGMWDKHSNFETSTHSPLLISVPGQKPGRTAALVEFVDIYPSLCELCCLSLPDGLEGASFKPLIENPHRPWKEAAFSQYRRVVPDHGTGMGYSMRTDRYRFTRWVENDTPQNSLALELYDHESDPGENVNVAQDPRYKAVVDELATKLQKGWRDALPPKTANSEDSAVQSK